MIVDAFLAPFLWLWDSMFSTLPDVGFSPPEDSSILMWLGRVDSFVPIGPVLQTAMSLLTFLVAFVAIRFTLVLWKALPFT